MSDDEWTKRVLEVLQEEFELDSDALQAHARLREDLDFDSLDALDMTVVLEKRYGVVVPDHTFDDVSTVAELVERVRQLMEGSFK